VSVISPQPAQVAATEEGPVTPCYEVLQGVQIPKIQEFTLILFKWGSVPVKFLLWRKRRRHVASLWRTRSSKHMSFWMRSGHPSFVDEASED
jgi:hypothetical protein